ncbi:YceI family protein [Parazoarcus communis]|uniref:YceI family protein n=1 Tax=Parazoarcus communis TaxID=41977 RepID=UPI002006DE62|nr:YceI family protein [Parazoarcus communis]
MHSAPTSDRSITRMSRPLRSWRLPLIASAAAWLLAGGMMTSSALAAEFTRIDTVASQISFHYTQMGVGMDGHFSGFTADIRFDPARPETARAVLQLELSSIDTGSTEANSEVKAPTWFDTAKHPKAHFEASSIKALGGNRYEATGTLTIKGRSRPVTAPFTFTPQGRTAVVDGSFVLKRGDFSIGEGEWVDYAIVGNEIRIGFKLHALQALP